MPEPTECGSQAAGGKHANGVALQDCVGWPDGYEFKEDRLHRGNPYFWKDNGNKESLRDLAEFVDMLPFFCSVGKITIIHNEPGVPGMEHVDHKFEDLVSEFVWFRCDRKKQFYVRDTVHSYPWYVDCNVIWFHDRLTHNISPIDEPCFSVRVDGKFSPWFRDYLLRVGYFFSEDFRLVLAQQIDWKDTSTRWEQTPDPPPDRAKKGENMSTNASLVDYYKYVCAVNQK